MQIIFRRSWHYLPDLRLDVEASDRIDAILARTAKIVGSPVEQFSLWNNLKYNEKHFKLENCKTFSDYQISEGDRVPLRQEFNIVIAQALSGNTLFNLEVEASESIYQVKLSIDVEEGIDHDCIQLGVGTAVLEDNKCVLDCGLKADSRVWLVMVAPSDSSSLPSSAEEDLAAEDLPAP